MNEGDTIKVLECPCGSFPVFDSELMPDDEDGTDVGTCLWCLRCGRGAQVKRTVEEAVADWNATRHTLKPSKS